MAAQARRDAVGQHLDHTPDGVAGLPAVVDLRDHGRAGGRMMAAHRIGVQTGDIVRVTSRRGSMTLPARVVETIRPDTVFIPYHWAGQKAANQLTNLAVVPLSKLPEFKVAAVRVERAGGHTDTIDTRDMELHGDPP
jgi:formylmethanofuran dehydrogenase subunit D